ncbi:hypothetical protein GCM10007147_44540 [Nocardiopsis kunsanensis]|uniref:Uncharacterized protein n=1 Tax=Nocardiopsis kunsanensis TaxID=141693 RepID=A0A918XL40_9ACTN|nr:hypothetical protein [Nocardiopsis kunsanensis]GHD36899.1 hypothetical protein GCM10007147_44540 [Nocardiopsis kunsanensis]
MYAHRADQNRPDQLTVRMQAWDRWDWCTVPSRNWYAPVQPNAFNSPGRLSSIVSLACSP